MSDDVINLEVHLGDKRIVMVPVAIFTSLSSVTDRRVTEDNRPKHEIDRLALETEKTLHQYLARITRGIADKGEVRAFVLEPRDLLLLERLGVTTPTDPIVVSITDG